MKKEKRYSRISLRGWLTLWFSLIMLVIGALMLSFLSLSSRETVSVDTEEALIELAEHDARKLTVKNGRLVVRGGFVRSRDGMSFCVYDEDGKRVYGSLPIDDAGLAFQDGTCRTLSADGTDYYLYDLRTSADGLHEYRIRGCAETIRTESRLRPAAKAAFVILPTVFVLAVIGGYAIAGTLLAPMNEVTKAANSIAAGDELSLRIKYSGNAREIGELTTAFNSMFERLEGSFRRERRFTSDVSHELRTPISVVLAECEYSLASEQSPEEYRRSLETVQRQTERMSGLVTRLLHLSRLEQDAVKLSLERFDLAELVLAVADEQRQLTDVDIRTQVEKDVFVEADIALMTRLLENLVSNARKFGSTRVDIRLCRSGDEVQVSVEDDGIGIPKAEQEKIWERFYQIDRSRSDNQSGSCGLGLSMVRRIAQLHGAAVTVHSSPGEGSRFTLTMKQTK